MKTSEPTDGELAALPEFSTYSSCLPAVILRAIARRHQIPPRVLTGTRRSQEVYAIRQALVHLCLEITGYTQMSLAAALKMHRGQIAHIAASARDRLETDPRFAQRMEQWSIFLRQRFELPPIAPGPEEQLENLLKKQSRMAA